MLNTPIPELEILSERRVVLRGDWRVQRLSEENRFALLQTALQHCNVEMEWDAQGVTALDHAGALLLWNAWACKLPAHLQMHASHMGLFARLRDCATVSVPVVRVSRFELLIRLGRKSLGAFSHLLGMTELLGQFVLDVFRFLRHPSHGPWREISANLHRAGFQAMTITAMVGILIGVVLSYLSAQQLRNFGGDAYVVNILGVGIIREMGPMLAAILVAGRSGSAMTAQLGVMRVTEELDAMRVMGIPQGFRLIMPKIMALAIAMPLLVVWTDAAAMLGGMLSAQEKLGISPRVFLQRLPDAVPLVNYWIGLSKGAVFGVLIALIACHFGLRIQPNTDSLGQGTTQSVVIAITAVIVADAIFAIVFSKVGFS